MLEYKLGNSLQGKIIISLPIISDTRFIKSVVFIASHSATGATGIIVNKLSVHKFSSIVKSIDNNIVEDNIKQKSQNINIVLGGPINSNNLFVIHSSDYKLSTTLNITDDICMTNQPEAIIDLANGKGPGKSLIAIGCVTWSAGQLEKELAYDTWLVTSSKPDIIFDSSLSTLYNKIYETTNIGPYNPSFFVTAKDN